MYYSLFLLATCYTIIALTVVVPVKRFTLYTQDSDLGHARAHEWWYSAQRMKMVAWAPCLASQMVTAQFARLPWLVYMYVHVINMQCTMYMHLCSC